ncbi:MAG: hypothetical protein D6696_17775 [Acidobacteria bacterium]|nr:MAG: hypothetical protein D6696_17775 [Acidobacteriota bacterium]
MAIETGLEGKPWYYAAAIAAVLAGGIYFATDFFLLKNMRTDLERKEQKLTSLQLKISEGRNAKARLPQFEEEIKRLRKELEKLEKILPPRRNTEDLLRRIRTLADQGDFNLLRFTPQAQQPQEFYTEWPIRIELEGTYHNLAMFFDRIGRFPRIINVEDLSITALKAADRPHHTIRASFTAKTFLRLEQEAAS